MEEDYDYDEDQFLEYDADWIFVEDEYGLAVSTFRRLLAVPFQSDGSRLPISSSRFSQYK